MWSVVEGYLKDHPTRLKVAKTIVELGLHVGEDGAIYCGPVEIPVTKLAKACGVDRRVVNATVKMVLGHRELRNVFTKIQSAGPSFRDVAKHFGFGIIVINANPKTVGIVAKATGLIANAKISIRQILADDPELYPEPKLTIITDKPVPGKLIPELLKILGVKGVSVY